jgi:hypothetical protein
MDTKTTVLANFTASKKKVDDILALEKITVKDIEGLSPIERDYLTEITNQTLATLKGAERDSFLDKINLVIPPNSKSSVWEYNHLVITDAIAKFMRLYGVMPTKAAIAEETGLSRPTIDKHIAAYKTQPEFKAQMEQFKFMAPKMLANVFKFAGCGDMKAARLYFEIVGALNKTQNTVVNEQNNYIQINNTILNQENLKTLTAAQLNQIENIITNNGRKKFRRAAKITNNGCSI